MYNPKTIQNFLAKGTLAHAALHNNLYNKAKDIIKNDTYIKFYDASRQLYLKTYTSYVGLGARLLQVREEMNCGCGADL